ECGLKDPLDRERTRRLRRPVTFDGDRPDDPRADDNANGIGDEGDDRKQRVPERALADGETEKDDVPRHDRSEHVEPKEGDRVDRTCGEGQSDKKEVPMS